jgi:hypothetical protein
MLLNAGSAISIHRTFAAAALRGQSEGLTVSV